jgi:hypothetical protein
VLQYGPRLQAGLFLPQAFYAGAASP